MAGRRGEVSYILFSYIVILVQWKLVHIRFDTGGHTHENLMLIFICHIHYSCHTEQIPLTCICINVQSRLFLLGDMQQTRVKYVT